MWEKCKGNGGIDGRIGGAMGIDDENRGCLREVELKQKCVRGNGDLEYRMEFLLIILDVTL